MREIRLTRGLVAVVDDEDYELINQHKYKADRHGHTHYAARAIRVNGRYVKVYMHREIANAPDGLAVDHIDWNGLNNTRSNLRVCTVAENLQNRRGGKQITRSLNASRQLNYAERLHLQTNTDKRWRIELIARGRRWQWRKGSGKDRVSIYGGTFGKPQPIEPGGPIDPEIIAYVEQLLAQAEIAPR